jgi:microcystin-dependent protein
MSTLSDIKTALREMLPSGQRLKVDKHKEVNDKLLDYMFIPFGVPFPFLGPETKIPSNCAKCDGRELTKEAYPYLFEELGNLWGGDGITTFNLPLIPAGASIVQKGTVVNYDISVNFSEGTTGGTALHRLTRSQLPKENILGNVDQVIVNQGEGCMVKKSVSGQDVTSGTIDAAGSGSELNIRDAFPFPNLGDGTPHNNMPPYIVGNWIMRLY